MRRLRRAAAVVALAALLAADGLASADPPDVAASQIGQGQSSKDLGADQLSEHASPNATGVTQVSAPPARPAAPAQIIAPVAGRNTQVQSIAGHDRCDPASPQAGAAECARIPENRAQDFQPETADATANTVDSSASSADLVNGILSSGTGSVVQLPPK
jgi:hypothetical protein